ncbi:uncharacterized protein LOC125508211 isoform X3 [Triticum urartu]|uniref:uncharacterized protein LOC125508211 isoform X3 n=1 Tax=Triticum urartu TaxID=4572 RepID=UPI0020437633|nr:uncharacterized protein LOC125508211 isoform X3 [Triticum urartu]XP_048528781.1 uncharacterized protein LOC125508211 isoform X3 [Triticum urartu]
MPILQHARSKGELDRPQQGKIPVHQIYHPHRGSSHGLPESFCPSKGSAPTSTGRGPGAPDPSPPTTGGAMASGSPCVLPFSKNGSTPTTPYCPRSWRTTELPCGVTEASSTMTPPALPLRWPRFFFHSGIARGYGTSSSPMKRRRGLSCQERCVVVGLVSGLGIFRWPWCRAAEAMLFGISYKIAMVIADMRSICPWLLCYC